MASNLLREVQASLFLLSFSLRAEVTGQTKLYKVMGYGVLEKSNMSELWAESYGFVLSMVQLPINER